MLSFYFLSLLTSQQSNHNHLWQVMQFLTRNYSGKPLTKPEIEERVLKVVKSYDKITAEKVHICNEF